MGLVKYIEIPGLGTADHDVNQTQGDVKTRGDVDIPLEEPATMLVDSLRGSESTRSKKRKNDMPKRPAKKILYSKSGESSNETEGGESDLAESVNEFLTEFKKKAEMEAHLHDQICRYRMRTSLQNQKIMKLVKAVRKLKDPNTSALAKGREAIRMVAKNSVEHAKVVEALKKELAEGEEKLKELHQQLEKEKERVKKVKQVNEENLKQEIVKEFEGLREHWKEMVKPVMQWIDVRNGGDTRKC
ncbi:hypothetical protein QVD17_20541 [Tagetes erecta]|uniref:Uncharacterized protein n=1 Tax=Tagetes erecta TaxID=13708 RepID=A0AAD8KLD7_TARER|nr:hypothetical protein QVD17_20541 [Tagetes erecta]